jgi:hypothetical protein
MRLLPIDWTCQKKWRNTIFFLLSPKKDRQREFQRFENQKTCLCLGENKLNIKEHFIIFRLHYNIKSA